MTNVKYYALRILNFTEDVWATKTIMFEINDCENTYTDFELHYLNRKGGYDSFTFSGKSQQNTLKEREHFTPLLWINLSYLVDY